MGALREALPSLNPLDAILAETVLEASGGPIPATPEALWRLGEAIGSEALQRVAMRGQHYEECAASIESGRVVPYDGRGQYEAAEIARLHVSPNHAAFVWLEGEEPPRVVG